MPSIRGSSQFKSIKGITVYGATGSTGPQGPRGNDLAGPTGATAFLRFASITLSGYTLISTFQNGITFAATGLFKGITGNTSILMDGKTGSTGTGYIFKSSIPSQQTVVIRKLEGTTGIRSSIELTNQNSNREILVNVDRYDGTYTHLYGELTDILATDGGGNLVGATLGSAKYGKLAQSIKINKANVFEKTESPIYGTNDKPFNITQTPLWFIYPTTSERSSRSKILSADLENFRNQSFEGVNTISIQDSSIINSFSLHLQNGNWLTTFIPPEFEYGSGIPVVFPFNKIPCPLQNQNIVIHFVNINSQYYGYIFGKNSNVDDFFCADLNQQLPLQAQRILQSYNGMTGACCTGVSGCTYTTYEFCDGFFAGAGTTCGITGSYLCSQQNGSCCVKNTIDGKVNTYCLENISVDDCLALNNNSTQAVFNGIETICSTVDCSECFEDRGACCDGKGNCTSKTQIDCILSGGNFLGKAISCVANSKDPVCSTGTGACCTSTGTCTNSTAETCFENGGYYFGTNSSCSGITCNSSLRCGGFLETPLKPGDLFGGGMVVGVYSPNKSKILGARHAFSRHGSTADFMFGGETTSHYYQSECDYIGYGFTGETCAALRRKDTDSYYIIVSLYPASVDRDLNGVNPTQEEVFKEEFAWYGSGIAWGPMLSPIYNSYSDFTFLDKTYEKEYLQYGEGFYGITGESLDNIKTNTFQTCYSTRKNGTDPIARLFARNIKTSNGLWHRNWGLYNTIRMLCADNANYLKINSSSIFTYDEFAAGITMNSLWALKLFDNNDYQNSHGLTANPEQLSDWYIPSHDELAFIAANTVNDSTNKYYGFNVNQYLLANNGIPLYGWHWSSTGSFDTGITGEGIYTSGKPEHGSVAWGMYFDSSGQIENYKVKKENRTEELKIRPIRAMRCDGLYPDSTSDSYKLWKVPDLLRNIL
jgi:hypothetical protein